MNIGPDPQISLQLIEETRKQINRLFDEVARLSEMDLPPNDYYGELLKRVLTALAAPAGAVWVRTQQGNLQLQYQINLRQVGLEKSDESRKSHDELLRQAFQQQPPRAMHLPPQASTGKAEGSDVAPGNPTDFVLLLAPIIVDKQVAGLIEVWQTPNRHPEAINGFLQFLTRMAELASLYTRNHLLRQMGGQQQLWTQLEAFARQVHGSLNPVEVGYLVANEGRRLIECDRVSVAVRYTKRKSTVEAISGADVVEKRSNLVQLMRALFDSVLAWGEKLVYKGVKDDSLPPDVLKALDEYLAESNSKLLVVQPLRDEREKDNNRPSRTALLMECFEPSATPDQLVARLDVVGKHSASALYNAVEHRRIPFRFIWKPLAKVQEGLGGKARAIIFGVVLGLAALGALLWFVPYPLKMDATGQLLPRMRRWVYSPSDGTVIRFDVSPGDNVDADQSVVRMFDQTLEEKLVKLNHDIDAADAKIRQLTNKLSDSASLAPADRNAFAKDILEEKYKLAAWQKQRQDLVERTHAESDNPGYFRLRAPAYPQGERDGRLGDHPQWTVLNWDFREHLINKNVKSSEPLLRLGNKDSEWEIETKIPQKHIGQVLHALEKLDRAKKDKLIALFDEQINSGALQKKDLVAQLDAVKPGAAADEAGLQELLQNVKLEDLRRKATALGVLSRAEEAGRLSKAEAEDLFKPSELDVDLLVRSDPTRTFKGKLKKADIGGSAQPNQTDQNESEPVILASIRISGDDIPAGDRLPPELMETAGTEVKVKVRCGNHRMGYSLFYGVWEFFYEKVVFFF